MPARRIGRSQADLTKHRKYDRLAAGEFFVPVVQVATAYVAAAITGAALTEGEFWALSCLPGTTPGRLSALTMRATDILVIYKAAATAAASSPVDALMIVERSTLEAGFGSRQAAADRYPGVRFTDSHYYGAGEDQMMVSGPHDELVTVLGDDAVADAAHALARRMMDQGRVLFWRGHNPLLADHVLGRA
jgi:hypothetical protein